MPERRAEGMSRAQSRPNGRQDPDQVERLAYHAVRGEVWAKAVTYCQQAGTRARDRAAFHEAVVAFEQALQALSHLPEDDDTRVQAIEFRLALRGTLYSLGAYERCLALLGEAEALARALDDGARLGRVLAAMAHVCMTTGNLDGALGRASRPSRPVPWGRPTRPSATMVGRPSCCGRTWRRTGRLPGSVQTCGSCPRRTWR